MKIFILRPRENTIISPWKPWYDKAFGFIVRAETEAAARSYAHENAGNENDEKYQNCKIYPWLDDRFSDCEELSIEGEEGMIMRDFHAA